MLAFSNAGVSVEKSDHSFEVMWKVFGELQLVDVTSVDIRNKY